MRKEIQSITIALLVPSLFVSCSTAKHAYMGPKRDVASLATIESKPTEQFKGILRNHKENAFVTHVNDVEVGSSFKGYPKKIFVLPGENTVRTNYHSTKAQKSGATMAGIVLGAGVGGVIGSVIDQARNAELLENTKKSTTVNVEAGKTYYLKGLSSDGKGKDLKVWIEDAPVTQ